MIRLKPGVKARGIRPEITLAVTIAEGVYRKHGQDTVVTSLTDGAHKKDSLHYKGLGVDLRTRHLWPGQAKDIARELNESLGSDYDVVLESGHIHVEFDPK